MPAVGAAPAPVQLAADGKALQPIVLSAHASESGKAMAKTLAEYLRRITGADFEVKTGDGSRGIVLGTAAEFPALATDAALSSKAMTDRENCLLRSSAERLLLLGSTDPAVRHACWDFLYRIGYRQFFPGKTWEIVPAIPVLGVAVDVLEKPSYHSRKIWYGYGPWDYAAEPYRDWCEKNRATGGIELRTGHSYDGLLHRHASVFAAHPEYLALVNGKRQPPKLCISNDGLRKLAVEDALKQFADNPSLDSVSEDPSDGGGWCECEACKKLGSVSDRALLLANEVAREVNAKYPGKLVGMYAYNYHSPPPSIEVDPHVIISVATGFIKGGLNVEEIINGWAAKGARLGIREYYEVSPWDRDLPGQERGGNIDYLRRTIPEFYGKGARFMSAESGDSWGPCGLGFYLASRMMWDVKEAANTDALIEDFLTRAFGLAKEPMREFYRQIDGSKPHLVHSDQLGRMFRALNEARPLAQDPEVQDRLQDLTLYCRYVDLFERYSSAKGAERQKAFEEMLRHTYRMRKTMLVHTKGIYRDLPARDKAVRLPDDARWNVPEGKNPWKSSEPFSEPDIQSFIAEGIERNPLTNLGFEPVAFSNNLASPAPLHLPDAPRGSYGAGRGKQVFLTYIETAPATLELKVTGGMIAGYRDRGNVRISLWKVGGASQAGERETLVAEDRSVPPDGQEHSVTLSLKESGLFKLVLEDGSDMTRIECTSPIPWTLPSSVDEPMNSYYGAPWTLYFYVPRGAKVLGLYGGAGGARGEVRDPTGRVAYTLTSHEGNYFSVPVPEGSDGKLWSFKNCRGPIRLLTVPPFLARSPAELLVPAEVVQKDGAKDPK